jgi:hypothetical protein
VAVSYRLSFSSCHVYEQGQASITLSVRLAAGAVEVEDVAKLDTGSSYCVFQRELGEALGLVVDTGEPMRMRTTAGWFDAFGHGVRLAAVGVEVDAVVYFAAQYGFPINVLGRHGWIDRLRVGLLDYDGMLFLSHYDDPHDDDAAG